MCDQIQYPSCWLVHSWDTHLSACALHNCRQKEWNVEIESSFATDFPVATPTRCLISVAAAVVKVMARIFFASTPCQKIPSVRTQIDILIFDNYVKHLQ